MLSIHFPILTYEVLNDFKNSREQVSWIEMVLVGHGSTHPYFERWVGNRRTAIVWFIRRMVLPTILERKSMPSNSLIDRWAGRC